ncbi:hypothetical protein [Dactylosporangium sp. CA-233914]|uniref:hypothetical protein n=1 Tax=Dactylosporangium sp. CA-233914 TaxID=3239934 RepID=UPI003D934028
MSTVVLSAVAGLFGTATPARAGQTNLDAPRISWAYTDSAHPDTTYLNPTGNAPLGAWRDANNRLHVSRVYATFDVAAVLSKHILSAKLAVPETQATDCAHRQIEVWATAEKAQPTWRNPPRELVKLGTLGPVGQCPANYPLLDLVDLVNRAVAAGIKLPSHVSFEVRLPGAFEHQVSLGRRIDAPILYLGYNTRPPAPGPLFNGLRPCATGAPYPYLNSLTPVLGAQVHDADPDDARLTGEFAIWPVDRPDQRTTVTQQSMQNGHVESVTPPADALADNTTYAWQARVNDGTDDSPWSQTCYFTTDATAPANAPTVNSPNYPSNTTRYPGGDPIVYNLGPNGVDDVYGYQYSWNGVFSVFGAYIGPYGVPEFADPFSTPGVVHADQAGGGATLTVSPPNSGFVILSVRSFDRAFNLSPVTSYRLIIANTAPSVNGPADPVIGVPFQVDFTPGPNTGAITDYVYTVNGGAEQTVPATPNGTASVEVTADRAGSFQIEVRSRSANGWVSPKGQRFWSVTTAPAVTSDITVNVS